MGIKIMAGVAVLAVVAAINGAVRKFGGLDVMTAGFVIFAVIFLGVLIVVVRND